MRSVVEFDVAQVLEIVNQCSQFEVGVRFTADRASFVLALVEARKTELSAVLGG